MPDRSRDRVGVRCSPAHGIRGITGDPDSAAAGVVGEAMSADPATAARGVIGVSSGENGVRVEGFFTGGGSKANSFYLWPVRGGLGSSGI